MKIAVIGAGNIAVKHLEVLKAFDDVQITALCNAGHPRIHEAAERFGIERRYIDYRQMLDSDRIGAELCSLSARRIE